MAVGSGAPPVNSEMLELGRMFDAVPSENVVVRLDVRADEIDGEGTVADEVPASRVLLSSEKASEAEDAAEDGGATDEDDGTVEDEAGPAEESAALLEGGATLDGGIAELLGAGLLDAGGWLDGGCEASLGEDSGVALLGSDVALGDGAGDEEGVLRELGD